MTIAKENKEFIDNLIEYYISESESYKEIAEKFRPEIESIEDTAFGIITGCVYSGFLQKLYQNQQQTASLEDIKEFNEMIKNKASQIKKAISSTTKKQIDQEIRHKKDENQVILEKSITV